MLLEQLMRAAASRTFWTAGSSRPMRMAMMAITTNSSISVKPLFHRARTRNMRRPPEKNEADDGARVGPPPAGAAAGALLLQVEVVGAGRRRRGNLHRQRRFGLVVINRVDLGRRGRRGVGAH